MAVQCHRPSAKKCRKLNDRVMTKYNVFMIVITRFYGNMANVVICEVLCFILNKYGKLTKTQLKSTTLGFFNEDELNEAKGVLFTDAGALPRSVKRAKSDNRCASDRGGSA